MSSELVLLFNPNSENKVLDQLSKAFDKHSYPGNKDKIPSLVVVNKKIWTLLEGELQKMRNPRYDHTKIAGYDKVTATSEGSLPGDKVLKGFNSLTYRSRPIVAIDGDNIISARVGGMNE